MGTAVLSNVVKDPSRVVVPGVTVNIRLWPGPGFRVADNSEIAQLHTTTSDTNGAWSATLEKTSDISPSGCYWLVDEQIPESAGGPRQWLCELTDNATVAAARVNPTATTGLGTYLTQAQADARYIQQVIATALAGRGTLAARPASGTNGQLYVAEDIDRIYEWSGTAGRWIAPDEGDGLYAPDWGGPVAAFAQLASANGRVRLPAGGTSASTPTRLVSGQELIGVIGAKVDFVTSPVGTVLNWTGASSGHMLEVEGQGIGVRGVGLDSMGDTVDIGLQVTSTNTPPTRQVDIEDFFAYSSGTANTGTAVQMGVPGDTSDPQMDELRLENFEIQSWSTGIRTDSYNALSLCTIKKGHIRRPNKAVHLVRCGPVTIEDVTCGGHVGVDPCWFEIESEDDVTLRQCQGEDAEPGAGLFCRTTGNSTKPVTLERCTVNRPCEFHGTRRIVVIGGCFTEDITLFGGASITLIEVDFLAGKGVVRDASSTGTITTIESVADGTPMIKIDSGVDGPLVELISDAGSPSLRLRNTAASGGAFDLSAHDDGTWSLTDVDTGRRPIISQVGAMDGAIGIDSAGAILQGIPRLDLLSVNNAQAASGPVGTVVKKVPIYDHVGVPMGFIAVYDAIT